MIKTIVALVLSAAPAAALECTSATNKDVLAILEKNAQETVKNVAIADGTGFPIELTLSDAGTWTLVMITPKGMCFLAMGHDWQAVEPKPPGVEN